MTKYLNRKYNICQIVRKFYHEWLTKDNKFTHIKMPRDQTKMQEYLTSEFKVLFPWFRQCDRHVVIYLPSGDYSGAVQFDVIP